MPLRIRSCFKDELMRYMQLKIASGNKQVSLERYMNYFDDYIVYKDINKIRLTKEDLRDWYSFRPSENDAMKYARVNWSIHFLQYLSSLGYDVYIPKRTRCIGSKFTAYIYTEEEISEYFKYIDTYYSVKDPMVALYLPVVFRLLLTSGTRIEETLAIRVKDVDLDNGIIHLTKTKGNNNRDIPLTDEMTNLMRQYADKCLYLKMKDDFFFSHIDRRKISQQSIYHFHRKALKDAGIKFYGGTKGPRLHDFRHTMAVTSLANFDSNGVDLNNALPILQRYLGHNSIFSTERYLQLVDSHYNQVLDKMKDLDSFLVGDEYEKS